MNLRLFSTYMIFIFGVFFSSSAEAICTLEKNQSSIYCQENADSLTLPEIDPSEYITPETLVITVPPSEEIYSYNSILSDFYAYLENCLHKKIVFYPVYSSEAEIEAMRLGHVHIASFLAGSTIKAMTQAGAVPFAIKGNADGPIQTNMVVIVRQDSPFNTLLDLKNKRIAHTNTNSSTGYLASQRFFPREGLIPNQDYQSIFSGKHYLSIFGVKSGDYDAATIALEVLEKMIADQIIDPDDFRVIYQKGPFPSNIFSYKNTLSPEIQAQITSCFFKFHVTKNRNNTPEEMDRFIPLNYQEYLEIVRETFTSQ
ncbi:phosphate/phosphite/phosphonate ABC transporter substrate-binding protein [Ignatzschineria sp. LJL83]